MSSRNILWDYINNLFLLKLSNFRPLFLVWFKSKVILVWNSYYQMVIAKINDTIIFNISWLLCSEQITTRYHAFSVWICLAWRRNELLGGSWLLTIWRSFLHRGSGHTCVATPGRTRAFTAHKFQTTGMYHLRKQCVFHMEGMGLLFPECLLWCHLCARHRLHPLLFHRWGNRITVKFFTLFNYDLVKCEVKFLSYWVQGSSSLYYISVLDKVGVVL